MNLWRLLPFAAILVLIMMVGLMRNQIQAQTQVLTNYHDRTKRLEKELEVVVQITSQNAKHLADMQSMQNNLQSLLSTRETTIKEIHYETPKTRSWAHTTVPPSIASVRERPALTGATAYATYLSNHQSMHVASKQSPDHQRGTKPLN